MVNKRHKGYRQLRQEDGVTLLELMISTLILGIVITVAMPSFSDIGDSQRLIGATEQLYNHIQQARSESVSGNTAAFVNFNAPVSPTAASATWQYGISVANSLCALTATTPTTANACVIVIDDGDGTVDPGDGTVDTGDLVLMRFTDADWTDVSMQINGFSSGNTQIVFNPVRGTATSGTINLVSGNGKLLRINVGLLGRAIICSPDGSVINYKVC
ncbi:MAG: prepilin-type N-terminal cleavage/methylation domain-containing protein [Gammaproteobacteria bacterium]|nr:prepilin-type N-terminal cleavage/methylation domain-containing protein [Gammaproteobacteria bacterium]